MEDHFYFIWSENGNHVWNVNIDVCLLLISGGLVASDMRKGLNVYSLLTMVVFVHPEMTFCV